MNELKSLLSRKFIFAMAAMACGFYLTAVGKVDPKDFFTFISVIGGIYVAGNVTGKVSDVIADRFTE